MIRVTAYQCEICKTTFTEQKKAEKCNKACDKKLKAKRSSAAYKAKRKKKSDWLRLHIKSIDSIGRMIAKFYKENYKVDISVYTTGLRVEGNFVKFQIKAEAIDKKSRVSMDAVTTGDRWGQCETYDGDLIISGLDLNGGGSGFGHGFNAGCKLDMTKCPHLNKLIEERNSLDEKVKAYVAMRSTIKSKVEEIISKDELYTAHKDRNKIFTIYSNLANKLAGERHTELYNIKLAELKKELLSDELVEAYKRHSELSSALGMDNQ